MTSNLTLFLINEKKRLPGVNSQKQRSPLHCFLIRQHSEVTLYKATSTAVMSSAQLQARGRFALILLNELCSLLKTLL
jgi:hypothetical protein